VAAALGSPPISSYLVVIQIEKMCVCSRLLQATEEVDGKDGGGCVFFLELDGRGSCWLQPAELLNGGNLAPLLL
jgi:hypothetical protein